MTLSWRPPKDGGSRIRGYLIQKQPKGSKDWLPVNEEPHPLSNFTVPDLTEGEEYAFRIIAVNDVGESTPSKACPFVKVSDRSIVEEGQFAACRRYFFLGIVQDMPQTNLLRE